MGNISLHRAYSITTTVEQDEDGAFAVFDTVRIGKSEKRIARFKGNEGDALAFGEKLAEYWIRSFEKPPSIEG